MMARSLQAGPLLAGLMFWAALCPAVEFVAEVDGESVHLEDESDRFFLILQLFPCCIRMVERVPPYRSWRHQGAVYDSGAFDRSDAVWLAGDGRIATVNLTTGTSETLHLTEDRSSVQVAITPDDAVFAVVDGRHGYRVGREPLRAEPWAELSDACADGVFPLFCVGEWVCVVHQVRGKMPFGRTGIVRAIHHGTRDRVEFELPVVRVLDSHGRMTLVGGSGEFNLLEDTGDGLVVRRVETIGSVCRYAVFDSVGRIVMLHRDELGSAQLSRLRWDGSQFLSVTTQSVPMAPTQDCGSEFLLTGDDSKILFVDRCWGQLRAFDATLPLED